MTPSVPVLREDLGRLAAPLWYWMNERHAIYLRRKAGEPGPWTEDDILRTYAFCNVFRELDRVTVWVRERIREPYADHPNLWLMLALARTINWPETLEHLMNSGVWPWGEYDADGVAAVLDYRQRHGAKVYTGAYMIRAESDPKAPWYDWTKQEYVARIVIGRLWAKRKEFGYLFHAATPSGPTLEAVWRWFLRFHGWGPFMAYEVVTDLRWTRYLDRAPDIYTWANAGPGALRGLNRLLGRKLDQPMSPDVATGLMRELLRLAPDYLAPTVRNGDAPLELRDIEHSLCETDKYLRVRTGEGRPRAKFRPSTERVP